MPAKLERQPASPVKAARPRLRLRDVMEDSRIALMLALGFACGLPILLVFSTLSAWLATAGIQRTSIGLLSYVSFAYSLKFIWAPVIDRLDLPVLARLLGRRRAWMVLSQIAVAAGLIGMSQGDPAASLSFMVICALITAFASATQDIVVDSWRIDAAPTERQGVMLAAYQLGYAVARAFAGAGALYIAQGAGWSLAYGAMALLMLIGLVASLLAPRQDPVEVPGERRSVARTLEIAVVEPFGDLIRRKGARLFLILSLIMLYRLPDIISGVMAQPFYIEQGFTLTEIANVTKIYGVIVGIVGALAGGFAVIRFGLQASLLFGGIVAAASNLMFSWLAVSGHDTWLFVASISIDNFAGNFAGTALIAYMSSLTSSAFVATQYALLSSLYALPGKFVGGFSGYMVDAMGYPKFFAASAAIGIPVALLCLALIALREGAEDEAEAAHPPEEEAIAAKA
ncbi:AmpG family muropeptide MFS transporter [Methylobacterium oxalidis]|uniref:MFS transporter n=1 Tax=Methylobacterium oxalidis TaxID=944322 RepID=A0A512J8F6_9HYPH|nr:MFS transporter [Methylobacterium oxalidis]GEP06240.1 MFS transporter [Methylobacterium oxalidis]GJE31503.1 Anhydromuropeptide permease [Methylobacterium oxalidis]GLS66095.1 MFS transporter [Methylobacterium oxalidis]